jgi:6-phosphogluconate dehydrogenase
VGRLRPVSQRQSGVPYNLKYVGRGMLPTHFMEAEMDFFGAHVYERSYVRGEDPGKTSKGAHHYEGRPA